MIITKSLIENAKTENGGWTKYQLNLIGVDWPPHKDWIKKVIGKKITKENSELFVKGKNKYITKKVSV